MRGACLDAENIAFGRPEMTDLLAFASPPNVGHRMVAFDTENFYWYHRELQRHGFETALVLTGQSYPDQNDYPWYSARWARTVQPTIWLLSNEWNVSIDATWPPGGDEAFISYWNQAAPAMKEADPACLLYMGGLFSEPDMVAHVERVWRQLNPRPAGIDVHPYMESLDQADVLLRRLRETFGCEIAVMEWNDSRSSAVAAFQRVLDARTEHSCWFCWSDGQVAEHGLLTERGTKKATYRAYQRAIEPVPARSRR